MSARYYNLVGALAWIATRNQVASDDLNAAWDEANASGGEVENRTKRVVSALYLSQAIPDEALAKARAELRAACGDAKVPAKGRKADAGDVVDVPIESWLDVFIDESNGTIGRSGVPTWSSVRFRKNDVHCVWKADPSVTPLKARKPTGQRARYRDEVKAILDLVNAAEVKALDAGNELSPRPTNKQIADRLSERHGTKVPERTIAYDVQRLGGNINWLLRASA